mmetsp:Transcript_18563/g.22835  ORF Transcript_18563/g.22835 Transcript_18563/m.22835 type:complete len:143 (+) Transcript_18563:18-446(+)
MSDQDSKTERDIPESIKKLREYRMSGFKDTTDNKRESFTDTTTEQLSSMASNIKSGPYAQTPPIYLGKLDKKGIMGKTRLVNAFLGLGLTSIALGIYGYTVYQKMSHGINDDELNRLEREALQLVASGEIDLNKANKKENSQ